jgi:hypothetical protein
VYWKVSPLPEGEGASLRFNHQALRLNIACTAAGFELTVWGKRAPNGLLKYQQEEGLGEVLRQQIPASLPALLAALHQLIATGLLTAAEGQLHYK